MPLTDEEIRQIKQETKVAFVAVRQCQSINPTNPLAVAENIGEMYQALSDMVAQGSDHTRLKSCGHPVRCACPGIKAKEVLAKLEAKR